MSGKASVSLAEAVDIEAAELLLKRQQSCGGYPRVVDGHVLVGPGQLLREPQQKVWLGIVNGKTMKAIAADDLKRNTKTAEYHREQLYRTLGIYDVAGLVRAAVHIGLIEA